MRVGRDGVTDSLTLCEERRGVDVGDRGVCEQGSLWESCMRTGRRFGDTYGEIDMLGTGLSE